MDAFASSNFAEDALLARGTSVLFDACAEALLNEPTAAVIADMQRVAGALGDTRFEGFAPDENMTQRFYDRFIVTSSRLFVPVSESCIRGYCMTDAGAQYGGVNSAVTDHVVRCYEAVGFDWKRLRGYRPLVETMRADSLAVECAFVAFLKQKESMAPDAAAAHRLNDLTNAFVSQHLGAWARTAALCLARGDDDFSARTASFAAGALDGLPK